MNTGVQERTYIGKTTFGIRNDPQESFHKNAPPVPMYESTVFPGHMTQFFPEKCDLNSTRVLYAEGKYYFRTYKHLYIYYTTSLSWDSEICFQIMRSDPNVYNASHVIPGIYAAAAAKCSQV